MTGDASKEHTGSERPARVRSFIALPVSGDALDALRRARDALERRASRSRIAVRFLSDEALHVTLRFLGSIDRDMLDDFARVIEDNARIAPFSLRFTGLDAFSSPERARVVVAALADPEERLARLARGLSLGAEKLGVPPEERAFRPHVTLARIRRPADVRDWLARASIDPVTVRCDEIRLYQSLLHPHGSRYSVLARAEFRDRSA